MDDEQKLLETNSYDIKQNYICMAEVIDQGTFEDYIEAAEELAKEMNMPVLVSPPYRGSFLAFPERLLK